MIKMSLLAVAAAFMTWGGLKMYPPEFEPTPGGGSGSCTACVDVYVQRVQQIVDNATNPVQAGVDIVEAYGDHHSLEYADLADCIDSYIVAGATAVEVYEGAVACLE